MLSIKKMVDAESFSCLKANKGIDDFDPMAFQAELPDRQKNKGLAF